MLERVCELDLEGVVAKNRHAPYVTERDQSTWFKIRNREYSQMVGREELFERDRHSESVAGWHACVLACVSVESSVSQSQRRYSQSGFPKP